MPLFGDLISVAYKGARSVTEEVVYGAFLHRTNFNIPESDVRKPFIYERNLARQLIRVSGSRRAPAIVGSGAVHLHNAEGSRAQWHSFVGEWIDSSAKLSFAVKNFQTHLNARERMALVLRLLFSWLVYLLMRMRVPSAKHNLLGLPELCVTMAMLMKALRGVRTVYFSGVYDPEANILSYVLSKSGSGVSFLVSGTPLRRYLTKIYCDKLYLSNMYQKEELGLCRDTMVYAGSFVLPPSSYRQIALFDASGTPEFPIGIYTTGIWKRRQKGVYHDPDTEYNERMIFEFVDRFIAASGRAYSVAVYCHPVEKENDTEYAKAQAHYTEGLVNRDAFRFAPRNEATVSAFGKIGVAVCSISNTLFERLFAGYKTLIVNARGQWFPHEGSPLRAISASDYGAFEKLLGSAMNEPVDGFFKDRRIGHYRFAGGAFATPYSGLG